MAEAVGSSLPCGPMACAPEVKPTWAVAATPKWLGFVIGRQWLIKLEQEKSYSHYSHPTIYRDTYVIIEGSLEVKLQTIWTDEKQSREEAERRERSEGKKMEMREKVESRETLCFSNDLWLRRVEK